MVLLQTVTWRAADISVFCWICENLNVSFWATGQVTRVIGVTISASEPDMNNTNRKGFWEFSYDLTAVGCTDTRLICMEWMFFTLRPPVATLMIKNILFKTKLEQDCPLPPAPMHLAVTCLTPIQSAMHLGVTCLTPIQNATCWRSPPADVKYAKGFLFETWVWRIKLLFSNAHRLKRLLMTLKTKANLF